MKNLQARINKVSNGLKNALKDALTIEEIRDIANGPVTDQEIGPMLKIGCMAVWIEWVENDFQNSTDEHKKAILNHFKPGVQ